MKRISSIAALVFVIHTASAQGTFEAMLNYAGTAQPGGDPVSSAIYASINGPVGWTFKPTSTIKVTSLGVFDYLMPGQSNLRVGLWDAGGTLLASQNVTSASASIGQSHYESITPLLLAGGQTYYLAAYGASEQLLAVVVTPDIAPNGYATMSSEIQLGQVAYSSGTGFSFPGTTEGAAGYAIIAPNFQFQVIPEPSVMALLGLGIAGFLIARRGTKTSAPHRPDSWTRG
jgi:hypothetical protein